eukprot:s413_g2.t1
MSHQCCLALYFQQGSPHKQGPILGTFCSRVPGGLRPPSSPGWIQTALTKLRAKNSWCTLRFVKPRLQVNHEKHAYKAYQAFVRRRAFLRSFGGVGSGDNEILELAPAKPMMSIALNFVRRLKSFRWVNIEREATLVAGLVDAQAANITMRDVSAVVNYYQDKVPSDHLSLNVLQEALDRQVIVAKEALQELKAATAGLGAMEKWGESTVFKNGLHMV